MKGRIVGFSSLVLLVSIGAQASIFGEETAVLIGIASNQLTELAKLAEHIGVSKQQRDLLIQLNEGVNQTVEQINSIEKIIERAQGLDPTSMQSLSDINRAITGLRLFSGEIQELLGLKLLLCDEAVESASVQSDTAYKMGQEMEHVGSQLAIQSQSASPGRAQQITASAASAQMLATGVQLQTMAQISQLLAFNLDLQKSQMQRELQLERTRQAYMQTALKRNPGPLTESLRSSQKLSKKRGR